MKGLKKTQNRKTLKVLKSNISKVSTVRQLKRKYNDLPLSYLFGIIDEIDYQCPRIDSYIDEVLACKSSLIKARRARKLDSKNAHLLEAMYKIDQLDEKLDRDVRDSFIKLREYADQWKRLALLAINDSKNPEKYLKK